MSDHHLTALPYLMSDVHERRNACDWHHIPCSDRILQIWEKVRCSAVGVGGHAGVRDVRKSDWNKNVELLLSKFHASKFASLTLV